jgi:hypothetical protein
MKLLEEMASNYQITLVYVTILKTHKQFCFFSKLIIKNLEDSSVLARYSGKLGLMF